MKLFLVAIYDKKAREYSPPQGYPQLGVAERQFGDAVNNPESHLNRHPEDYNMQIIGEYNTETGVISPSEQGPQHLMDAAQLLQTRN